MLRNSWHIRIGIIAQAAKNYLMSSKLGGVVWRSFFSVSLSVSEKVRLMFSIFINFCNDELKGKKVQEGSSSSVIILLAIVTNEFSSLSIKISQNYSPNKDSSESSLDDDAYLDEQEDPMTDQQTQNNQTTAVAGAGNTLPIKSTSNAARSVKFPCWSESIQLHERQMNHDGGCLVSGSRTKFHSAPLWFIAECWKLLFFFLSPSILFNWNCSFLFGLVHDFLFFLIIPFDSVAASTDCRLSFCLYHFFLVAMIGFREWFKYLHKKISFVGSSV